MNRCARAVAYLFLTIASALALTAANVAFNDQPAHAQANTSAITIEADQASVYEGGLATFTLTRYGGHVDPMMVQVKTWEPDWDTPSPNPTEQTHDVMFAEGSRLATLRVAAYRDTRTDAANTTLKAQIQAASDNSYSVSNTDTATVEVVDFGSSAPLPVLSIANVAASITEGSPAEFRLTRAGEMAPAITVEIRVEDQGNLLRGDLWDPPPEIPTQVDIAANHGAATLSIPVPDDLRDMPSDDLKVVVLPSSDYLLGEGIEVSDSIRVNDNDAAQELELNFGKDGTNGASVSESNADKLAIVVKRRQQDANSGNSAFVTVRVETDRGGDDWRLEDWTEDTGTGRLHRDYPLELTGSDLEVKEELRVTFNGEPEGNWNYWASIRPIEGYAGGQLTSSEEAQYWTVKSGFRETAVNATDSGSSNGSISIDADVTTVTEGQSVLLTLYRVDGPMSKPVTVQVRTREPSRNPGSGTNPSTEFHDVTIQPWEGDAEFTVYPYVDAVTETGTDELIANIVSINQVDGADRYLEGSPNRLEIDITDPPSGSTLVTVAANPTSVVEGGSTTVTFTRAGGDTAQPLTVNIGVVDPDERLRGNHWDTAPAIPTEVTFPANSTTRTVTLTFPDDQRDLELAGLVYVHVLPGMGYYLGQTGKDGTFTTLSVSDNDTAQELTFKWGQISHESEHWEAGESYLTCDQGQGNCSPLICDEGEGNCTPGPAEGTFYYEDGRSFVVQHELQEPHPAHFLVSRRAQDIGKTTTFVVRVEHNRGWESPRHTDWSVDPETGNRYKEFPLTLTGNQRQVVGRIELLDNGIIDHNLWQYSAEIRQIEDAADGNALSPTVEGQYWTVSGDRKKTIRPDLVLGVIVKIDSVAPKPVAEGQAVTITLERQFGNPLEPYEVQVRTWEPNRSVADGTNPTDQIHDVVFPAVQMTDRFVQYVDQTQTLTVATYDDSVYEPRDTFMAALSVYSAYSDRTLLLSTKKVNITDDDRATITLSVDDTSIAEGETATFTLTRGNNTANELIVGVSVDDPGGFLEGNYASEAVAVPSNVVFAAGEATKEIAITPPDDWRDIPDNAITFTVATEPDYDIVGSSSLTVQVADNDVAPQVSISFNHAEVDEGNDLVLMVTRTGEDKNPLEIPVTVGPVGNQQYGVFGMDEGISQLRLTYRQPDDSFRGPDHHYEATIHPGRPEFWLPTGATTVNGAILDNDPYVVSVEAITREVDEGNLIYYRISHSGHTGEPLQVMVDHTETGNAVYDGTLGNHTHTIPAGSSSITRAYLTHRNDGYDGAAEFTVELLADAAYEIDGGSSSATVMVRDKDPLPVLGFPDTDTVVSEGAGTVEIWVDLLAAVAPLKTVTVDFSVNDHFTGDGLSVTQSTGTLTFAPGETSAAITVEVLQNSIAGYKERFHVVLSNPVHAALQDGAANLVHDGVIEDDESVVTLEAQAEAVDEGSDVILTLTRTGDTTNELTVWLQVAKTAPQADSRQDTVVFPAEDATVEHTITTTDDEERNGSHTVTATLLDPPTIGEPRTFWVGSPSSDRVTVREISLETVNLLTPTLRVAEGESISLELTRSGASPLTVTLEVTETGDYTTGALPETVSFGLQERHVTVTIPTQNDTTAEDVGKLTVTLVDGTNYRAGWPNTHTFTIYDDDGAKPAVSVTRDQAWVNEGQPVSFTVSRSTPTDDALQARLELNRVRYRVTRADLDDPTRGITTPENHIHFDTEEITVDFPAGTRTVTVTRPTDDDSLNYGNSTYHATVLNDADDDYVALYNASAFIWVQDDDIPTVTGSSTTIERYAGHHQTFLPFTRTGDDSGRLLLLDAAFTGVVHQPAPLQDDSHTRSEVTGWGFAPGDSTGVSIGTIGVPAALGRSGTIVLQPHYCPNNPSACGYYPQYQLGTPSSITYRYYSNFMGVRIKRDKASVSEGDSATFTLHRHGGKPDSLTRPLDVKVLVTQEGDFITGAAPQTVTFAANQSTATLSLPTTDDGVDELDGAITVELLFTGVLAASDSCPSQDDRYCYRLREYQGTPWYVRSVTTAVTDDDYVLPDVSVSDASAGEADGTIEFTVSLSQANNERAASVDWSTGEDGSTTAATSDVDFTAASGTVNFAIGETEKTVTVTLLDDRVDETDETFNLVLSNPSELTLADDTGMGTILDDDLDYGIAFSQSTFHTEEGDDVVVLLQRLVSQESGGGICYVTIEGACFSVATVGDAANTAITVNLDITQTGDFLSGSLPTTVSFAQGVASVELSLPTVDDSTVEADGSLSFKILEGAGYSPVYIGPPDSHTQGAPYRTLYLYDNDLTFSIDDVHADESAGQLDFAVSLNEPAPQQLTVDVATADGEATSHGNVTATSLGQDFEARTDTLTFAAGEQTKTFSVVTLDDTIQEKDETFTVKLSTPAQNLNRYNSARRWSTLTSLADGDAVGTIVDDEAELVASISRAYSTVDEGHSGPVRFMVDLSHPTTTTHERRPAVAWEVTAGTATAAEDYLDTTDKLTFPVGATRGFIEVEIVDDELFEEVLETFTVQLIQQGTRLVLISQTDDAYEASIRDNETLAAAITANAENVAEGEAAVFTVTLTGGVTSEAVMVQFETSGTASAMDDYGSPTGNVTFKPVGTSGNTGTLEIPAGVSSGAITFPILTDSVDDDDETLKVELFNVSSVDRTATVSAGHSRASSNILDVGRLIVSVQGSPSVDEGSSATFTVYMTKTSDVPVSVDWSTRQAGGTLSADETAEPDRDYTAETGTVAIPAGSSSATFTVTTLEDTLNEGNEKFRVALEEARNGSSTPHEMLPLGVTEAVGTIVDNDPAPTGLTISSVSHNEVDEDAGATDITVTVALDGTTQFTVDTPVTVEMIDRPNVHNNATLGVDYTATTANVKIPAGQSSVTATITLTPVDDSISEGDEIARLSVKSTVFARSVGKGVKIKDNDVEPGEVILAVSQDKVSESASSLLLTVTGTLMGSASRPVDTVVSLELADDTATAGQDYETATATLTIPAGEMSATAEMTLIVLDDNIVEGDETLEVTGAVPGTITARPVEIVIEDDDQEPTSISLVVTAAPLNEGGGAVTVPVQATLLGGGTRSADTQVTLRVADLTATLGDDYTATWDSSTLTIPAGEFSATANLTLTLVDDTLYEGNEHIAARGGNSDPGLPVNGVRLTILDNDPQPTTVILTLRADTVSEGDNIHFEIITATLQGDSTLTADVNFSVSLKGDTQRSQSYNAVLITPLRIEAGQSSGTAELWLSGTDDDVEDEDETVTIDGVSDHPDLDVVSTQLIIANDDTSGVRVSPMSLTIEEGKQQRYAVSLATEPTADVVLTVDVPANAGFTVNPGTVTFTPSSWGRKLIFVEGTQDDDGDDEPAAEITHSISSTDTLYRDLTPAGVLVTIRDDDDPLVEVSFGAATYEVDEGGTVNVTLSLSVDPERPVTIPVTATEQDGASNADYSGVPVNVTFASGETQKTVTFAATQDAVNDDGESVKLGFGTLPDRVMAGTTSETTVTITDDDEPEVKVSFAAAVYPVAEGGTVDVTVTLDADPERTVIIPLKVTEQNGASSDDYSGVPADITINAGEMEKSFTFTATQDDIDDDGESVMLNFDSPLPAGVTEGSMDETIVVIGDDDTAGVTISETSLDIEEGDSDTYTVVLDSEPVGDVTVTIDGVAGTEASLDKTTLTFKSGNWNTARTVTVTAEQDDDAVDEEEVTITHTVTSTDDPDYDGIAAGSVAVTVTDDDTAGVTISETSLDFNEGESDTYTVVLDTEPVGDVTVTIGGVTGTDVTLNNTTLTFTTGNWNTALTVTVTAVQDDDAVDEEEVTITHTVTSADDADYDGVSAGSVAVTVTDDDTAGVTISETSLDIIEGESDTYTVVLDTEPVGDVTVTIGGVTGTEVTLNNTTLTFTTGNWNTAQTVTVTAGQDGDGVDEEEVTITHTVTSADDTDYDGIAAGSVVVAVTDDDDVRVRVSYGSASYTVAEGDSVTVKVVLDADPERTVEVPITVTPLDGASAADFSGVPATVVFNAGDTEKTFSFSATQDTVDDDGEGVRLTFGTLPERVTSTGPSQAVVSITDDDVPNVTVSFEQASYTIAEGGSVTVKVVLDADPERTVTVPITKSNQDGASNSDYSGVPASVVFSPGDTEVTFDFDATDDVANDDGESVKLGFGNLPSGVSGGTTRETVVSITDDDVPSVNVSFGSASYTVAEGNSVTVKVVLSADPERTVTVPLTTTNQGGATSADYSGVPANVVFNTGDTEKTFSFSAADDTVDDDDESVKLGLGNLPTGVSAGTTDETTVSITDDDVPSVTVSFEQASYTVAEGNSVTVKVILSADPKRMVTIPLLRVNQGGASSGDYSGVPASVVFSAGDTEVTFDFAATDDAANDDGESVRVSFGTMPDQVSAGANSGTTVSITDDDVPEVTVSFEQASYIVAEGSSIAVKMKLDVDPERTLTIPLTKVDQGGASASDYSVPNSVVFNTGDTEKTISFTAADDSLDDDGESVKLGFGNLPTDVSAGTTDETTVSITDDDVPSVTVSFEQASYTVAEGGSVTVKVVLDADPERTVTVPITKSNQDGASNSDYSGVPANVVFNSGDTEKTFSFAAASDSNNDDGESVKLGFDTLPAGVSKGTTDETTVSITDDDVPSVTVSFEQASYTVEEGGRVTVKVVLDADPERTVTVPITKSNQGGASNSDYSGVPANVVFNSGDMEKTFAFSATQDTVDDDGEGVRLTFGTLPERVTSAGPSQAVVSITDDDVPSVTVSFEQASYTVAEGGSVTVKVVLDADPEQTVTIPLTKANQDGASGSDYSGVPANVVFNSGDTEKTFSFAATQDTANDDGESVKLGFGTLPAGVSAGTTDEATVSITDDDVPSVTVRFEQGSYTVAEGGSVTVKVVLDADPERTVTIPLTETNQGGASNSDYSGVPANVVFNSGDTEKTFSFNASQDTVDDDGESVRLTFGGLPARVTSTGPSQAVVSITDDDVPSVTVSFGSASYTVAEGNSVTVKVVLSADPERTVTVPITKSNEGGATNSDYSGVPANLVFNSGDTEETFSFAATQDTANDDGESVKLGFGNLPTGVSAGATNESTVSITDDDVPSVTVSFGSASYTVAEGSSVTMKVVLSAVPERMVTIPLLKVNQGGATSSDYSGVPANVVFNAGDTEKTLDFAATQDTDNDDGESVRISFGTMPDQVSAGANSGTTVSITDDDVPSVTASFGSASYTVAEGNSVTVKVVLSADPEQTVTVPITKSNEGGATNSDYSGVPANVVFNSGDTEKTFSFAAADDTVDDDGESVKLGFGNLPTGVSAGGTDEATVSITDDDVPSVTVSFGSASYTVAEGGSVTVKVVLDADPERTVTIPLTETNQGGASNSDYSGVPANVVFNSGDTEKTFAFDATQDTVDDDGESVRLTFGGLPARVTSTGPSQAVVSITDDDVPSVTVSFEQASYTVAEGGSVTVKVVLDADPERTVTIPLTKANQDGASGSDYSGVPASVVFNSGDTEETFSFAATQDTANDDGESVKLGFGTLPAGVSAGTTDEATVSITDDDVPSVTVSFGSASYTVAEGGSVTVKVVLDADPERTVTIPLTKTNQGGASNSDYSGVPANVVFNSGDTEKTFSFNATQDTVDDDGESVRLTFGGLPARVTSTSPSQAVVSITDDDVPSVTVSFGSASYTVAEGNSVTVKVVLSADPERTVTVPITKSNEGGATNSDYSGVPSNAIFNSGDTEKTFSFAAASDSDNDDGESVKLGFGNLPTGVSAGATNESTVSITDDDVPSVTVSFGSASYTVAEGGSVTVKVVLDADPERTVTIPLTEANQDGASGSDYSGVPANVIFNSGDTEKTFAFNATQDTVDDDGESVKLGFGNLPTGVSSGATVEATVSITDDDVPSVTVSFGSASYTVAEGNSVTVKVVLDADPERTVTVPITKSNQGGASNSDYSGVPANVVFNSGDTEKTFSFAAADDTVDDDGESVKLGFGSLPARVSAGGTDEATVSITDTDVPVVTVSFASATYDVIEGESATVAVTLSADPERTVTIPLSRTNQGGATDPDYSGVPSSVTFNSGDTQKTFNFSATDDSDDDDGESVEIGFGSLPTAVSQGATPKTVVSIEDHDGGGPGSNKEILVGGGSEITVSFERATYSVREGSTTTIKVILSADPQTSFSIPLTTTSGTGLTSSDYSGVPTSVDFVSGETEKSFTLTAVQDQDDEANETLTLGFGTLLTGLIDGDNTQADVTIVDSIRVSFGSASYQAYEGGLGAQVFVKLDSPAPVETVIPITSTGMNGATSADWTGVPSFVTFGPGDTQQTFVLMAYDDLVEDDGESVELGFGTLPAGVVKGSRSVATVELMNMEVPSCETAVWCTTVEFANTASRDWGRMGLGLGYHTTQEPYLRYASLSDNRFTFRNKEYQVWSMFTFPGVHPDVGPGSPGSIPEYSTFSMHILEVVQGELKHRVNGNHKRDWTLYIDGIGLPFTDVVSTNRSGTSFVWHHPKLQDLYADWTDGDTYEVMIVEDPVNDRPEPPMTVPVAPKYLRVIPGDGSLTAIWKESMNDGNSDISHYRLQWKLRTASWGNPHAVEEAIVQPPSGSLTQLFHFISGLSNYTLYDVRAIAVNGVGDSEPSAEHFGMPQKKSLDITETEVNGNQLTITYERALDGNSIPNPEAFRVLVNGGPREVTGVSISGRSVTLTLEEPAKRAIRASDVVEFRYVTPPIGSPAIKDTAGNYAYSCYFGEGPSEARNETDPGLLDPVSAEFTMMPASHGGPGGEVVFQIEFSEPVRVDIGPNYANLLEVEGGEVTSAWWLDGDTTMWKIVLEPASNDDVRITLPAGRACGDQGAPCGSGARRLSNQPEHTIPGPSSQNQRSNSPASGGPAIGGSPQTGQTLAATTSGIQDMDGMSGAVFSYQWVRHELGTATDAEITGATGQTYTVSAQDEGKALKVRVTFTDDAGNEESLTSFAVIIAPAQTRDVKLVNTAATGAPGIEGTPEVGQSLKATTSGISDDDGISSAVFVYQWLAGSVAIDGATALTYVVVPGDVGKQIRVKVAFTDDAGNEESLTSEATDPVAAALPPLTVSLENSPASHNGTDAFTFEIRFSEHFNLSFETLRDHAFTVEGGTVTRAKRQERGSNIGWTITVEPDSSGAVTVVLPATTDCADVGAICTADGRMLTEGFEFTVSGPGE